MLVKRKFTNKSKANSPIALFCYFCMYINLDNFSLSVVINLSQGICFFPKDFPEIIRRHADEITWTQQPVIQGWYINNMLKKSISLETRAKPHLPTNFNPHLLSARFPEVFWACVLCPVGRRISSRTPKTAGKLQTDLEN